MKLVIANIRIHQDAEGRFSLNDLHSASGGNPTHRPGEFLRNEQTQKLIAEIATESNCANSHSLTAGIPAVKTKEGRHGGSYGVKELVYAYAMWISPKFHLQVIRTFDEVATGKVSTNPRTRTPTITQQLAAHGVRLRLLDRLETEQHPVKRRAVHDQLDHASRLLGLSTPPIDAIGREALPDYESPLLEEFWEVFDMLSSHAGHMLNHARNPHLIAISLPQIRAAANAAKLALPDMSKLRWVLKTCRSPRFIEFKAVNSAHLKCSVKCWVFEAPAQQVQD